jgi:ribonuclease G
LKIVLIYQKKITDKDERKRLHDIVSSIKPKNFGIILRTVSSGRSVKDIHEDINNLFKIWEDTCVKIHKADNVIKSFLKKLENPTPFSETF